MFLNNSGNLLGGKQKERGGTKKKKNRSSCCTLSADIGYFGESFSAVTFSKVQLDDCAKSETPVNI